MKIVIKRPLLLIGSLCVLSSALINGEEMPPTTEDSAHVRCDYFHNDLRTGESERYSIRVAMGVRTEADCPDVPRPSHETFSLDHKEAVRREMVKMINGSPVIIVFYETIEHPEDCIFSVVIGPGF